LSIIFLLLSAVLTHRPASAAEITTRGPSYPPPVQAASDEGELALRRFRLPKGLKVELAAAEPLLANPVAFAIDEQGRFFVVETFRLHAGVTDIRGHMNWLDEELAVKTVEERVAYMTKHEGKRIADYQKQSDRLRLVWDADGDGKAEHASVFAEGFTNVADGIAAGVLARNGDVYFANIPNLWLFRESKGTGQAESKTSLSYGYGVRVGFLGHDLHGLRFGPDGRLYFTVGDRGAFVRNKEGKLVENRETGAVYRCEPDGANLEIFAFGLRNPQELAFDQFGNLWTGDNNSDGGDPARWVHVVESGDSGWRIGWQFITTPNARGPWLAERMCYPQTEGQAAYFLPPVANIANGPSGLTYYPGTGLNATFTNRFFLCDFRGGTGSGIHSFGVKPRGAGFELVERQEFIWEVLVTDGDFGYDGCFYLTDWVNGWNLTGKGRIYRVFDPATRGSAPVNEVKKLFAEGFAQRAAGELVGLLGHADQRVRQEAQFALAAKGAGAIKLLASALDSDSQMSRLHAVWGLGQILRASPAAPTSVLLPLLGDADAELRAQTAKVLGDARAATAYERLVPLLADSAPRPRFFAALALARLGRRECVPAVLEMLRANNDQDRYLRHAGVMALAACAEPRALQQLSRDPSTAVRLAAVVALRRLERPEVADFLSDAEPLVLLEAAKAVNDLPIVSALPKLAALLGNSPVLARQQEASQRLREKTAKAKNPNKPDFEQEPDLLFQPLVRRAVNAHFRLGQNDNAVALVDFAGSSAANAGAAQPSASNVRAEAISALGDWAKPSGRDHVTGLWRPLDKRDVAAATRALRANVERLLADPSTAVKLATIRVATRLGIKEGANAAFVLVRDPQQPANVRLEALRALASLKSGRLQEALKAVSSDSNEALRNEATKIQAQLQPADATGKLRDILEHGTVKEQQNALQTLGTLTGSNADEVLRKWMDRLLAGQVRPELQLDVLEAAAKRPGQEFKERLTRYERARPSEDELRSFRECLLGGNAEEGKKIFLERVEVSCVRCHKAGGAGAGEGAEVGPDLKGIGSRQTREYLLEAITFPNKTIAAGFENVLVTMKAGPIYAGVVKTENDAELQLNSPEDGLLTLKKSEIKARERGLSAMPEELRQVLTKQDLRDLVEFLSNLK
jgi:quinoprotein glucose dehydrogenase